MSRRVILSTNLYVTKKLNKMGFFLLSELLTPDSPLQIDFVARYVHV